MLAAMLDERLIRFRPRAILTEIGTVGAVHVIVIDWLEHRRRKILDPPGPRPSALDLPS